MTFAVFRSRVEAAQLSRTILDERYTMEHENKAKAAVARQRMLTQIRLPTYFPGVEL